MTTDESYDLLNTILERDYYVPDVSELCIGFEYSYKTDVIEHRVIESKYDLEFTFGLHLDNNLFVKKLDVEDIESFGFKGDRGDCDFTFKGVVLELHGCNVEITDEYGEEHLFRGVIKNKSELKRLFKQLNVL